MIKQITAQELMTKLSLNEVYLIDVRDIQEYENESIPKSHLIPLNILCLDLLPYPPRPIVCHCKSGGRSSKACEKLLSQDPSLEIYNLQGGITAWKEAGLPTLTTKASG